MDLKALIAKMDQIESKKILTEAEDRPDAKKKETTWTDKDGKKHPATQVQGHQSVKADKEADKEKKKDMDESIVLQSAIAKALAEEFGYDLDERVMPDGKGGWTPSAAQQIAQQSAAANPMANKTRMPASATPANPWANDPEKAKAWGALSPEDQKWLGGADPTDQFILARAPNKGKPAAPASLAPASSAGAATKPTDTSGAPGAQDDFTGVDAAVAAQAAQQADTTAADTGGTGQAAGPTDAEIAANNAALGNWTDQPDTTGGSAGEEAPELAMGAGQPAAGGINPTTLNRYKELLDKLEATGKAPAPAKPTQVAPAPKKPATGAGTKPANSLPGTAVPGGGNIADNPAAESVDRLADDQILAIIRNI